MKATEIFQFSKRRFFLLFLTHNKRRADCWKNYSHVERAAEGNFTLSHRHHRRRIFERKFSLALSSQSSHRHHHHRH